MNFSSIQPLNNHAKVYWTVTFTPNEKQPSMSQNVVSDTIGFEMFLTPHCR